MEGRRDKDKQFSERWFNWQHVTNIPTDFFPCRAHHHRCGSRVCHIPGQMQDYQRAQDPPGYVSRAMPIDTTLLHVFLNSLICDIGERSSHA